MDLINGEGLLGGNDQPSVIPLSAHSIFAFSRFSILILADQFPASNAG
jgi:hypothetical protein